LERLDGRRSKAEDGETRLVDVCKTEARAEAVIKVPHASRQGSRMVGVPAKVASPPIAALVSRVAGRREAACSGG
jgi:hypothetical protein